jgi:hypothetical protein
MKRIKSLGLSAALLLTTVAMTAGSAFATTAANTVITNDARLTYTGAASPVKASVSVTVSLVPSKANVTVTGGSAAYTGANTPVIKDTLTVTTTANGPASYQVTPAISSYTNATGPSVNAGVNITLGATTTTTDSGSNYLTVPAGSTANSKWNGITSGATIVVAGKSGTPYTLHNASFADNGNGTWKITWSVNDSIPSGDLPPAGVLVAEQASIQLDVLPGTVVTGGTDIVVKVAATVSTSGVTDATTQSDAVNTWSTTSTTPNVTFFKYVRNKTNPVVGAGATPIVIDGVSYNFYTGGVTGKTGDTLEYVLVASNTGAVDLAGSAITDNLPVSFVNLVNGAYSSKDIFYVDPAGTSYYLAAGTTGQASFNGTATPNMVINVGTGATSSTGGVIPAGKSITIAYQATIR